MNILVCFAGAKILIRDGSCDVYICKMQKVVLVAILDWGLGHASRMIPVIDRLLLQNIKVILAGSGPSLKYLQKRYPDIDSREMPSEKVEYSKSGAGFALLKRVLQQPRINKTQQAWTREILSKEKIDGIISDNVYGVYSRDIPSVIMTHQVGLLVPVFKKVFDKRLAEWLGHFAEVWVPDEPGEASLAGKMTENEFLRIPKIFIGNLSRLKPVVFDKKEIVVTALISGPEPQRSIFEREVLAFFTEVKGRKVLIRGRTEKTDAIQTNISDLEVYDFLDDTALSEILCCSERVVCRSGYSTLCDLRALGVHALVVPTPQQPEQEYLARSGARRGWYQMADQTDISILSPDGGRGDIPSSNGYRLSAVVNGFLQKL